MPCIISSTDCDCSAVAPVIESTAPVTSCAMTMTSRKRLAVCAAICVPFSTAAIESCTRVAVLLTDSPLLLASARTSSATTAKPFPAAPARAASTAALRARIFVWKEISSIVLVIFPMPAELSEIRAIACTICCICSPQRSICAQTFCTMSPACAALLAVCPTWPDTLESVTVSVSIAWLSSEAPEARVWMPMAT